MRKKRKKESYQEIANYWGVSRQRVHQVLTGYRSKYASKEAILKRDHYRCQKCGEDKEELLDIHHILPRNFGGTNRKENLIVLCNRCHHKEHWKIINKALKLYYKRK